MIKWNVKDGGPESPVTFYGIEIKKLFSIGFLKFAEGRREAFHTHAFHALTWFIKGNLFEDRIDEVTAASGSPLLSPYVYSLIPKVTPRNNLHRVLAKEDSWCFTIRGPWISRWKEYDPTTGLFTVLTHGRKILGTYPVT